jgi:hypothetical protein
MVPYFGEIDEHFDQTERIALSMLGCEIGSNLSLIPPNPRQYCSLPLLYLI